MSIGPVEPNFDWHWLIGRWLHASAIEEVKGQLKLVKSAAFQFLKEFPHDSAYLLEMGTDECIHASKSEPVGAGHEVYHRPPTGSRSDRWNITASTTHHGACEIVSRKYETQMYASKVHLTAGGHPNIYHRTTKTRQIADLFCFEPIDCPDEWQVSGYFRLRSYARSTYVTLSTTDLTPLGRTQVHQTSNVSDAAVLYLF